jgi:hypothetical protein
MRPSVATYVGLPRPAHAPFIPDRLVCLVHETILSKHEETIEVASEPSVVGDRHDGAVEGVEAGLEGLGGLDVEVVGRLVEQQQRGAGQLEQQDLEAGLAAACQ